MLENVLQKQRPVESAKCIKCKKKEATRDDQMCDNCRFMLTLESIVNSRKETK